jgi:hypothetical protein
LPKNHSGITPLPALLQQLRQSKPVPAKARIQFTAPLLKSFGPLIITEFCHRLAQQVVGCGMLRQTITGLLEQSRGLGDFTAGPGLFAPDV